MLIGYSKFLICSLVRLRHSPPKVRESLTRVVFSIGEFKSVIGCEDEVIQLKCNRSSRLAIYSANFGRTEYESIQCPQPKGVPEECKFSL